MTLNERRTRVLERAVELLRQCDCCPDDPRDVGAQYAFKVAVGKAIGDKDILHQPDRTKLLNASPDQRAALAASYAVVVAQPEEDVNVTVQLTEDGVRWMEQALRVAEAARFAIERHAGQTDKSGVDYIHHPAAVAADVDVWSHLPAVVVAWLHDVVEDERATWDEVRALGLSEVELDALYAITQRKGHETHREYVIRCAQNPLARRVKRADVRHNTRPDRVKSAGLGKSMLDRYRKTMEILVAHEADQQAVVRPHLNYSS